MGWLPLQLLQQKLRSVKVARRHTVTKSKLRSARKIICHQCDCVYVNTQLTKFLTVVLFLFSILFSFCHFFNSTISSIVYSSISVCLFVVCCLFHCF